MPAPANALTASVAPHLSDVLAQSRAQLRRKAGLSQELSLAIWANQNDEVHYQQQGHHTLSVYLAAAMGRSCGAMRRHGVRLAGSVCFLRGMNPAGWCGSRCSCCTTAPA